MWRGSRHAWQLLPALTVLSVLWSLKPSYALATWAGCIWSHFFGKPWKTQRQNYKLFFIIRLFNAGGMLSLSSSSNISPCNLSHFHYIQQKNKTTECNRVENILLINNRWKTEKQWKGGDSVDQIFGVKQSKFEVQRCHRVTRVTLCKKMNSQCGPGWVQLWKTHRRW